MVPKAGLEPASCCQRGILNPLCLPIPPLRQVGEAAEYTNSRLSGNGTLGFFSPCCILLRDSAEPHPVGPVNLSIFREKRYGDEAHQENPRLQDLCSR